MKKYTLVWVVFLFMFGASSEPESFTVHTDSLSSTTTCTSAAGTTTCF